MGTNNFFHVRLPKMCPKKGSKGDIQEIVIGDFSLLYKNTPTSG